MQLVDDTGNESIEIGTLSKKERRVLGVLIEKSLTTPEYYPLTLKAATTGCNQKSNRSPVSNYDEFEVEDILEELQKRQLVSMVHTAGGRSERYRHLLREKLGWGQSKLTIMGELLLRGQQQMGELRSRASRMASIETLDQLRNEVEELISTGHAWSSGDLHRRGIEVNHALYTEQEQSRDGLPGPGSVSPHKPSTTSAVKPSEPSDDLTIDGEIAGTNLANPPQELRELRLLLNRIQTQVDELEERLSRLEAEDSSQTAGAEHP